jgi:hypothetical protein
MTGVRRIAGLVVLGCLAWAGPAAADPVTDWNAITLQVAGAAGPLRPGPSGVLDLAVVHIAVHDAVQAFEHRFQPYHARIRHARGSRTAAVAKAAHDVLVARFPAQAAFINDTYDAYLRSHSLDGNDPGVFVGQAAAADILALRANDGSFPNPSEIVVGGTAAGEWRPTQSFLPGPPPSFSPMAAPWLGAVEPFTKRFSEQFRPAPPPPLTSNRYARDYNEVKGLGARSATTLTEVTRTPGQTDLAHFYNDNLVALCHRTLRGIALARGLNLGDSARLFALASMASADAVMTSWDSKKLFNFWRPLTAIQEGNNDGNPRTAGDPAWQPFINTPPYSDYTSGANNVSGSITRTLELFFRTDRIAFSVTSANTSAVLNPRFYQRFSELADDMVEVRIYQGIHFRAADTVGRRQGRQVATQAFKHFLRPVHDRHDGDDGDDDDGDRDRDRRE